MGIRAREDCCFLMSKKSKHARSGIGTHASTRRPEHPNSSTIDFAQSTDDLKSGAFDHSAILAPIKVLFKEYRLCVEWFFVCLSFERWEACSVEYVKSNS